MKAEAFWDGIAKSYAAQPIKNLDQHDRTVSRAASYLGPGSEVLEIGCGTGTIAMKLAPRAAHVLATDVSGALLGIARQRQAQGPLTNVTFLKAGFGSLPEGQYDAVMAFNVLHLIEDQDAALAEMASRVKLGGVVVIKTGCLSDGWTRYPLRVVIGGMRLVGKAPFVAFRSVAQTEAAVERAGLTIVEKENMGRSLISRFLVARKPG